MSLIEGSPLLCPFPEPGVSLESTTVLSSPFEWDGIRARMYF